MSISLLFFPSTNISTRLDHLLRSLNQQSINNGESNENNQYESQISLIVTYLWYKKQGLFVQLFSS